MSEELCHLTIAAGRRLLERGELTSLAWTEALLSRIEAVDHGLHAYVHVAAEHALAQARASDRLRAAGATRGPLEGVPFSLKDLIDTAGMPTTGHSWLARGRVPTTDATLARRLREGGAVLLGKVALHEFAHGGPSPELPWPVARNPWNPEHFAGSSSSGSGVAVAAGLSPGSIGTDTGGSIRIPAGLCGISGLKPTYGLVSRRGVIPCAQSLDTCGPMAWTSEDCALLLDVIAGNDPGDPSSRTVERHDFASRLATDLRGMRIGVVRHFWEADAPVSSEARAAMETALGVLRDLGAHVDDVRLRSLGEYTDVRVLVQEPEVFAVHRRDLATRPHLYGRDFRARVLAACLVPGPVYVQASRLRRVMTDEMAATLREHDALVTIGPGPAARFDAPGAFGFVHALWGRPNMTSPFSVTGFPALSVCTGFSGGGLPLSMQIAARPFEDHIALCIGHAYETATPWRTRRPLVDPNRECPPFRLAPDAPVPPLEPGMAAFVDGCARSVGLALSDADRALLHEAAPHALAMVARLEAALPWEAEACGVFSAARPG